jgi:hypothetical protein
MDFHVKHSGGGCEIPWTDRSLSMFHVEHCRLASFCHRTPGPERTRDDPDRQRMTKPTRTTMDDQIRLTKPEIRNDDK